MTFGTTLFRTDSSFPPALPQVPMLFRIGDDWVVPIAIRDDDDSTIDLSGATLSASLISGTTTTPLVDLVGSVTVINALSGSAKVIVAKLTTAALTAQSLPATVFPMCISVSLLDSQGHKHTFDPIPILPLKASDYASVAVKPQVQVLKAYQQGPPGPSVSVNGHTGPSQTLTAADVGAATLADITAAFAAADDPFLDALIFGS